MIRVECPRCHRVVQVRQLEELKTFPFCSQRCKLIDLGAWLEEDYRISGPELSPDDSEPPSEDPDPGKKST